MSDLSREAASVGAVILAAGSASRIGHRPKCLLELNGEPLIQRLMRTVSDLDITQRVIVLGHYAEHIEPFVKHFPVTLARNSAPERGQNSSLHCGLHALAPSLDTIMVMLADQPLIETHDVEELLRAYRMRPADTDVMVPTVNDLPGNPVLFNDAVRKAILNRDDSFGCKQWQLENSARVYRWATTNEHYRIDIDTLDDIEAFNQRRDLSLRWPTTRD